jgi:ABC-type multidrug transport system fused ATPase/permease subunit
MPKLPPRPPEGLDTFMGEGGARLSGGQRQRDRHRPRPAAPRCALLLLDEATRRSTPKASGWCRKRSTADGGRTTIVIAHRLATVRAADRIIVMDHGQIVEEGDHGDPHRRVASMHASRGCSSTESQLKIYLSSADFRPIAS